MFVSLPQVVVALPSPQEKRPPQILKSTGAVAPEMPPLLYSKGEKVGGDDGKEGLQQHHTANQDQKKQKKKQQEQEEVNPDEARPLMELSYDKLVYAVGTQTGTFGVPGVREHCYMLKVCATPRRVLPLACHGTLQYRQAFRMEPFFFPFLPRVLHRRRAILVVAAPRNITTRSLQGSP